MVVDEETRPEVSASWSVLGLKPIRIFAMSPIGFEDVVSLTGLVERVVEVYPLSFDRAQELLDLARQREISRLDGLLGERAAAFDDLVRVLVEKREGTVDLLFVVSGDLYSGETVVLQWIQDFRETLRHVELDFVIVPSSVSSDIERSPGARVLYERGARPPGQS